MLKNNSKGINNLFLIAVLALVLNACDSNDYETIFKETPDERLKATITQYKSLLTGASYGWKATLYTGIGTGYFYYFDFDEDGNVTMLSDFNVTSAGELMQSTWTVKALQRPTLTFSTYSYIHLPADPDGNVNNGLPGSGLLSDFEFAITEPSGDSLKMKGLKHNSEIILVRATETETQAFLNKRIQQVLQHTANYLGSYKGYRLTLPNKTVIPMVLDIPYKTIAFQYLDRDGNTIQIPFTSYTFTIEGIALKDPIKIFEYEINKLIWDDSNNTYYVPFENKAIITGTNETYIFKPSTPLYSLLGKKLVAVTIPSEAGNDPLPGQSEEFTQAYKFAAQQMYEGEYRLTLSQIKFTFVPNTDRMVITLLVTQPTSSGGVQAFEAMYTYSYQVRAEGILKFKLESTDQNASALYADMIGVLNHFDNDTFIIEYVGGDFNLIGGFFSIEEPGFHFGGHLQK
ncbi:DUF4302 domain-containing protein [Chryseosolibacter indicus]|uniref:DUF4302 domain-containing protein n=1 Tax=Chryseosolibacter indicus TaxID=2782351 RepID=A0ABS5VR14_9BACT|nr:DUF4302 domain-containing protein [Chryseosolibacter indicus]MBT1703791.1 DUF4302 domain-containing protein [Chryseosolibacter indicus]